MKQILAVVALLTVGMANAELTGEEAYNNFSCAACHGLAGNSTNPNHPKLNGQFSKYIQSQLKAFQSGKRDNPGMRHFATIAEGFEEAIGDYLENAK